MDLVLEKKKISMVDVKDKKAYKEVLSTIKYKDLDKIILNSLQKDILLNIRKMNRDIKISIGVLKRLRSLSHLNRIIRKVNPYCITPYKTKKRIIKYYMYGQLNLKRTL